MELTLADFKRLPPARLRLYRNLARGFFTADPQSGLRDYTLYSQTNVVPRLYTETALLTPANAIIAVDALAAYLQQDKLPDEVRAQAQQIVAAVTQRYESARVRYAYLLNGIQASASEQVQSSNGHELTPDGSVIARSEVYYKEAFRQSKPGSLQVPDADGAEQICLPSSTVDIDIGTLTSSNGNQAPTAIVNSDTNASDWEERERLVKLSPEKAEKAVILFARRLNLPAYGEKAKGDVRSAQQGLIMLLECRPELKSFALEKIDSYLKRTADAELIRACYDGMVDLDLGIPSKAGVNAPGTTVMRLFASGDVSAERAHDR